VNAPANHLDNVEDNVEQAAIVCYRVTAKETTPEHDYVRDYYVAARCVGDAIDLVFGFFAESLILGVHQVNMLDEIGDHKDRMFRVAPIRDHVLNGIERGYRMPFCVYTAP